MTSHADAAPASIAPSPGPAVRPAGLEARRHPRARAHWPARLIDGSGSVKSGWICDVSEGGFGLVSPVNLPVGALLEIAFALPVGEDGARSVPVRCKVRVVFCAFVATQSRLGVQFLALPTATRVAIRSYVLGHC